MDQQALIAIRQRQKSTTPCHHTLQPPRARIVAVQREAEVAGEIRRHHRAPPSRCQPRVGVQQQQPLAACRRHASCQLRAPAASAPSPRERPTRPPAPWSVAAAAIGRHHLVRRRDRGQRVRQRPESQANFASSSCGGDARLALPGCRISPCCTTVVRDLACDRQKRAYRDGPRRPSRLRNPRRRRAVQAPRRSAAEAPQGSATYEPSEAERARFCPGDRGLSG